MEIIRKTEDTIFFLSLNFLFVGVGKKLNNLLA